MFLDMFEATHWKSVSPLKRRNDLLHRRSIITSLRGRLVVVRGLKIKGAGSEGKGFRDSDPNLISPVVTGSPEQDAEPPLVPAP